MADNSLLIEMLDTNWSRICLELRAYYKTAPRVARQVGSCGDTINHLANKRIAQPKFKVGIRLLILHRRMKRTNNNDTNK